MRCLRTTSGALTWASSASPDLRGGGARRKRETRRAQGARSGSTRCRASRHRGIGGWRGVSATRLSSLWWSSSQNGEWKCRCHTGEFRALYRLDRDPILFVDPFVALGEPAVVGGEVGVRGRVGMDVAALQDPAAAGRFRQTDPEAEHVHPDRHRDVRVQGDEESFGRGAGAQAAEVRGADAGRISARHMAPAPTLTSRPGDVRPCPDTAST